MLHKKLSYYIRNSRELYLWFISQIYFVLFKIILCENYMLENRFCVSLQQNIHSFDCLYFPATIHTKRVQLFNYL